MLDKSLKWGSIERRKPPLQLTRVNQQGIQSRWVLTGSKNTGGMIVCIRTVPRYVLVVVLEANVNHGGSRLERLMDH
jgi:hypothetical protein